MPPNSTSPLAGLPASCLSTTYPWYYNPNPQLWGVMSDYWVALLAPVAAFWLFAGFSNILDRGDWEWLQKYKIHESSEATSRNRVTKEQVIAADIVQEVVQITLRYFWMDPTTKNGGPASMRIPQMGVLPPTIFYSSKSCSDVASQHSYDSQSTRPRLLCLLVGKTLCPTFRRVVSIALYCSPFYQHVRQFLDRRLSILPPSRHSREHIPLQGIPFLASSIVCTLRVW